MENMHTVDYFTAVLRNPSRLFSSACGCLVHLKLNRTKKTL